MVLKVHRKKNSEKVNINTAWLYCPPYVRVSEIGLGLKVFRA